MKKDAVAKDAGPKAVPRDARRSSFSGAGRASLTDVPPPEPHFDAADDDDDRWDFPPPPPSPPASPPNTDLRFDREVIGVLPDPNASIPSEIPKPALPSSAPSAPTPPPPPPPPSGASARPPQPPAVSPLVETASRADTNQRGNLLQQIKEGAKLKKVRDYCTYEMNQNEQNVNIIRLTMWSRSQRTTGAHF
jgi:hypothetical protein